VTRERSPIKVGVALGLLSAAQLLIDPEVLAYCAIMAAVGLILLALTRRHEVLARVRATTAGLVAACACFAAIGGYPIGYFLVGPRRIAHAIQPAGVIAAFHVDLLRPVLQSSPHETDSAGYLGIPLLIGLLALAVLWRRLGIMRFACACAGAAFLLSLGPRLTVDGHSLAIWLPEALFEHVPVLVDLEPIRITGLEFLFLAIVLAVGLDRTRAWIVENSPSSRPGSGLGVAPRARTVASRVRSDPGLHNVVLLVLVVVAFVPLLDHFPVVREESAIAPQLTASLASSVPNGAVVLAFPYPRAHNDEPMLWQAVDEMSFRLVGGYALVPGPKGGGGYYIAQGPALSELSSLLTASPAPDVRPGNACRSLEAVAREYDAAALVLRTSVGELRTRGIELLTKFLGPPGASVRAGAAWYDLGGRTRNWSCPPVA